MSLDHKCPKDVAHSEEAARFGHGFGTGCSPQARHFHSVDLQLARSNLASQAHDVLCEELAFLPSRCDTSALAVLPRFLKDIASVWRSFSCR